MWRHPYRCVGPLTPLKSFTSRQTHLHQDFKSDNILLEIDTHEDRTHEGTTQSLFDASMPVEAARIKSEAIATRSVDSLKTISVRIVDFGVGEFAYNSLHLKNKQNADTQLLCVSILGG